MNFRVVCRTDLVQASYKTRITFATSMIANVVSP